MLPPEQSQTRDVFRIIAESIGAIGIRDTFKQEGSQSNDDKENPNEKKFGSLRRIRGMFSSNGPSMLFDHTASCSTLVGTNSITLAEEGKTNTYEVTIQTINASYPGWATESLLLKPNSYCTGASPAETNCVANGTNSGRYEKKMLIKKNNVLEEVLLFDCSEKAGRFESVNYELEDGKYRREKEILLWNVGDMAAARFERKSIGMEGVSNTFAMNTILNKSYEWEKVRKSTSVQIDGRVVKYNLHRDNLGVLSQSLNSMRFNVASASVNYSFYNFHENMSKNFFTQAPYLALSAETFNTPHFCGAVSFPLTFLTNCTTNPYHAWNGGVTFQVVEPVALGAALAPGYFPIGWN
jgi:hypothetical protein